MADAKLDFAVRRIAWGKFLNAGQTCICPDYLIVDKMIKEAFLEILAREVRLFYGEKVRENNHFARIMNKENVIRLSSLMSPVNWYVEGNMTRQIAMLPQL